MKTTHEIQGVQLENYRVPAVREFLHSFRDEAVEQSWVVKTQMAHVYGSWNEAFENMVRVYEISLKSPETAKIRNLDERRDNIHTAIVAAVNSARKAMDEATAAKGLALWDTLGSFPVDLEAQYNIQTAQIDSLLGVLYGAQRQNVEDLGLKTLVDELRDLNQSLHELIGQRDVENLQKPVGQRPQAMAEVIDAYRQLIKYVNAFYLVMNGIRLPVANRDSSAEEDPDAQEDLERFIDTTNEIINRFRRTAFRKNGTSVEFEEEVEEEETETSEGPDEGTGEGASEGGASEGNTEENNDENTGGSEES